MANDGEFREQIRQLGKKIAQLDELPESPAKVAANELAQLLMAIHGAGLERVMEVIFESGESGDSARRIIDKLGEDSIVGSLLVLYSLHPDPLETRLEKAVGRLRPRLRKQACAIEVVGVREGAVELRLAVASHACGSTTKDLRSMVEDCVYEFAPDVTSLKITGLEEPAPGGFVSLESLQGQGFAAAAAHRNGMEGRGAD